MLFIAHRGNFSGAKPNLENSPDYIDEAIRAGYDVEVDLRYENNKLMLGHDKGQYEINKEWLFERQDFLWIHGKTIETIHYLTNLMFEDELNYFFHEEDECCLTSRKWVWGHPKSHYFPEMILVCPGRSNWTFDQIMSAEGLCDDYISSFRNSKQKNG